VAVHHALGAVVGRGAAVVGGGAALVGGGAGEVRGGGGGELLEVDGLGDGDEDGLDGGALEAGAARVELAGDPVGAELLGDPERAGALGGAPDSPELQAASTWIKTRTRPAAANTRFHTSRSPA
jgi:hypothetical protein